MTSAPLLVEVIGGQKLVLELDLSGSVEQIAAQAAEAVGRSLTDEDGKAKAWRLFAPTARGGFSPAKPDADLAKVARSMEKQKASGDTGSFAGPGEHEGKPYLFRVRLFVPSAPPPKPVEESQPSFDDDEVFDLTNLDRETDDLETVRRVERADTSRKRKPGQRKATGSKRQKAPGAESTGRRRKRRSTGEQSTGTTTGRRRSTGEVGTATGKRRRKRATGELPDPQATPESVDATAAPPTEEAPPPSDSTPDSNAGAEAAAAASSSTEAGETPAAPEPSAEATEAPAPPESEAAAEVGGDEPSEPESSPDEPTPDEPSPDEKAFADTVKDASSSGVAPTPSAPAEPSPSPSTEPAEAPEAPEAAEQAAPPPPEAKVSAPPAPAVPPGASRSGVSETRVVTRALDGPDPERGSKPVTRSRSTQTLGGGRKTGKMKKAGRSTGALGRSTRLPEGSRSTSGTARSRRGGKKNSGMLGLIVALLLFAGVTVAFVVVLLKEAPPEPDRRAQDRSGESSTSVPEPASARLADRLELTHYSPYEGEGDDDPVRTAVTRFGELGIEQPSDASSGEALASVSEIAGNLSELCEGSSRFDACHAWSHTAFAAYQGCRMSECSDDQARSWFLQSIQAADKALARAKQLDAQTRSPSLKRIAIHSVRLAGQSLEGLEGVSPQLATLARQTCGQASLAETADCAAVLVAAEKEPASP